MSTDLHADCSRLNADTLVLDVLVLVVILGKNHHFEDANLVCSRILLEGWYAMGTTIIQGEDTATKGTR